MAANPKVSKVLPMDGYKLALVFTNGEHRIFDCSRLLDFGVFEELADVNYFRQVLIRDGTIVWPHEQDISPDTLYADSRPIREGTGSPGVDLPCCSESHPMDAKTS